MITNPYLKTKGDGFSLKGELKRLLGGPQILLTLLLIVLPLALSIGGGLDFATKTMYEMKYHQSDKRKSVWVIDCVLLNPKANARLCHDPGGNTRTYYWPPFLPANDPLYYGLPFLVALLSFVAIGNPRALSIGSEFKKILGLKSGTTATSGPYTDPAKAENIWLVGAASERRWQSDPGYFYQDTKHPKPYSLSPDMLRTNLLIVAPPGSGKTSSIFRPLIEYLRRIGASAIFFDSKGQDFPPEAFDLNFELNDPANSIKINLFSGDTPAQAGERLGEALIPNLSDDKQYYVDVAKDTCAALVSAHYAVYNLFPDLTELLLYLSEPDKIAGLGERVQTLSQSGQLSYLEIERLNAGLMRINSLLTNTKKDTLGSLNTAITPLTTSAASALLVANPGRTGGEQVFTIEEMLKVPRLVRLSLPVAENPRIAPIIGRIILTQFNFAVLSPRCNRNLLKIAAVDEAHNFITASIAKGMAQARSNNAGFMLALQTLSQIPDDSVLDTIFASAGNKLVMAGVGDQDAERFSKTYGELEMPYITHSKSQGRNTSTSSNSGTTTSYSAGRSTTGGSSTSGGGNTSGLSRTTSVTASSSSSQQLKLRRLFLPSEIRALPQYHAIIESSDAFGRRWGAIMIDMSQATLQQLMTKAAKKKGKAKPSAKAKATLPVATLAPLPEAATDVSSRSGDIISLVRPNNPARVSTATLETTNPTSESKADLTQPPFGKLKFNLVMETARRPAATAPGAGITNQTTSPLLSPATTGEKPVSGFGVNYPVQPQALPGPPTPSYSHPLYLKDHDDEELDEGC